MPLSVLLGIVWVAQLVDVTDSGVLGGVVEAVSSIPAWVKQMSVFTGIVDPSWNRTEC